MLARSFFNIIMLFTSVIFSANTTFADTLTLKDGQVLQGKFISRNDQSVVFSIGGQELNFSTDNVAAVAMDMESAPTKAQAPAETTAAPVSPAAAQSKNVTVPAGTRMMARTTDALNSKQHKAGHKFTARLEADLVVSGTVVAPRGATLYGVLESTKASGRLAGSAEMVMTFTDIMIDNQLKPIATTGLKAVTENTAARSTGAVARGAALGGLIGGSDDAKRGAKIGLGAAILTSGNQINIPRGTLIEFELTSELKP